ncbi:MAG: hypothetical protein J7518_02760 [Nocardioidaceae bacterium]|nr:hypothetical protein [Nocardioidaceae bacterium]
MPSLLVLAVLLLIGAVGLASLRLFGGSGSGSGAASGLQVRGLAKLAVVPALLAVLCVVLSMFTVVGTRNVGVVTTFGKPSGRTLGNGLHLKAPWQKVTDIDGTITTQKFIGKGDCVDVRIGDGSTACVSVVIRSRINQASADDIYADYRNSDKDINDNVNDALVRTQLISAMGSVFREFNPLLKVGDDIGANTAPDLQSFSDKVAQQMNTLLSSVSDDGRPQVSVKSITISFIRLSPSTQEKINDLQTEVAKTRIAEQQKKTAENVAAANRILAASVSKDPNVLVSKCLDIVATKENLPAGFNCWPGSGGSVVVPGTR